MIKQKKCKGTHSMTKGYGCGKLVSVDNRIYGLGKMCCYAQWLFSSENGKLKLEKSIIKAKANVKKEIKAKDKFSKEKLKPKSYYENQLQTQINQIVKYLDASHPCISSQKVSGKRNAGHFYGRLAHPALRFHLENIWNQSEYANVYKSGDIINYRNGLEVLYGKEYLNRLEGLKSIPALKLSIDELKEKTVEARKIVKWLIIQERIFTKEERLHYRIKFNNQIGIYSENPEFNPIH